MPQKSDRPEQHKTIIDEICQGSDDARLEPDDSEQEPDANANIDPAEVDPRIVD
jgi:hypothetical protein